MSWMLDRTLNEVTYPAGKSFECLRQPHGSLGSNRVLSSLEEYDVDECQNRDRAHRRLDHRWIRDSSRAEGSPSELFIA